MIEKFTKLPEVFNNAFGPGFFVRVLCKRSVWSHCICIIHPKWIMRRLTEVYGPGPVQ